MVTSGLRPIPSLVLLVWVAACSRPHPSRAQRGEQLARDLRCTTCHALDGSAPDASPPPAPRWDRGVDSLVKDDAEALEWILQGMPRRLLALPEAARPKAPEPMGGYASRLVGAQADDLLAWFKAVSGFEPEISDCAFEGRTLAQRLGCFGCHGPSGMGRGALPAWDGPDFGERVRDDAELRAWILDGRIDRIGGARMQAYRRELSDDQVSKLACFVRWLRTPAVPAEAARPGPPAPLDPMGMVSPGPGVGRAPAEERGVYRSPVQVVVSRDGATGFVVDPGTDRITVVDLARRTVVADVGVGRRPAQAALASDGRTLFVSCQWDHRVDVVDVSARKVVRSLATGWEPQGLALTPDGRRLFVANYLSESVSVLDFAAGTRRDVPVGRGPRFVSVSPDGRRAVVSNGLARGVTLLDGATGDVLEHRPIRGSSLLRDVAFTPDSRFALVAHVIGRDEFTPFQMERGWIVSNGFSILDLEKPGHRVTLLLDELFRGAANPTGLAVSADGRSLYVSLSGTHEVALVDLPAALALARQTPPEEVERLAQDVEVLARRGIARRVPSGGRGPRGLALRPGSSELLVATYFEEAISVLDARTGQARGRLPLGPRQPMTPWRKGELAFTDAPSITFQHWFSCVSCHEEDGGADALNWDLPNDGTGNPKNVKSLHDAYDTAPAMWTGVRKDLDAATAAGARFQGFLPKPEIHAALLAYLADPPRAPNPWRQVAPEAQARGEIVFLRARCDTCHPGPSFTDLRKHDLALGARTDLANRFDTPSLRECYRTGPYLHDGRAATLEAVFRDHDPQGIHGLWQPLREAEFSDLMAYLRSL